MKKIYLVFILSIHHIDAMSQLLFPESYAIIFDSTRHFKGTVAPSVEIKTLRQLYIEITNRTDMAFRFKNHGITVANKFELTRDGDQTILSGGFIYGKYKTFYDNPFILEHYAQYQWAEARGLVKKMAIGSNIRYKLLKTQKGGAFIGLGPFYEYELWDYRGVPLDRVPSETMDVDSKEWKINFYISTKRELSKKIRFEGALYFQNEINDPFDNPRWAGALSFFYSITTHIGFGINLQTIYDFDPVVPVDRLWFNTFSALEVTF
ncbi:DUF481 domain-containing protein [Ekhidna sp.]|uniref:DUF481 domain-containing protein n=1 Tax=Ekhidna sp. TaxID=2608089 RepID=UPI003C7BF86E